MANLPIFETALKNAKKGSIISVENDLRYDYALGQVMSRAIELKCKVVNIPDENLHIFQFIKDE